MKKMLLYIEVRIGRDQKIYNIFLLSNFVSFQLEQR